MVEDAAEDFESTANVTNEDIDKTSLVEEESAPPEGAAGSAPASCKAMEGQRTATTPMGKKRPGKQKGAPGFGRTQRLPVTTTEHHTCEFCTVCSVSLAHATHVRELLNDWDVIFRQLQDPTRPLTNNEAERALRHWVINHRLSHGTRSPKGTRTLTLLASVIETCRIRGAPLWDFLARVIAAARKGLQIPCLPAMPV